MYNVLILKGGACVLQYGSAYSCNESYYEEAIDDISLCGLYEVSCGYGEESTSCRLCVDDEFNIYLPVNGNVVVVMEPLPKALYLLFLRHPEGILLKNISSYREELELIYRKVSGRRNPTMIHRLLDEVTNPANNMLHKNLSIIRSVFLKSLPVEVAQLFIPVRCRGREQYVLLDTSCVKMPKNLH